MANSNAAEGALHDFLGNRVLLTVSDRTGRKPAGAFSLSVSGTLRRGRKRGYALDDPDGQTIATFSLDPRQVSEAAQQEDELTGDHLTLETGAISISIGPFRDEDTVESDSD
jgi:hypothetical protein